jgi:hypothetical protein
MAVTWRLGARLVAGVVLAVCGATPSHADDPPSIEHQPVPCTVPGKTVALCADVRDDVQVSAARVYFRASGKDYFQFVDMVFAGLRYCATLPAPREGRVQSIEYYLQAIDDQFQSQRTSTFSLRVQSEGSCGFPPVETDAAKSASIKVYATHKKQGNQLDGSFERTGVTFVPVTGK